MADIISKRQKLATAGTIIALAETGLAFMHTGAIGAIIGAAAGAAAYVYADDIAGALGRGGDHIPSPQVEKARKGSLGVAHRLLNGKSVREAYAQDAGVTRKLPEEEVFVYQQAAPSTRLLDEEYSDDFGGVSLDASAFTFSDLLATGWRPSYEQIFLARLEDGTNVFITVEQAVHIALAGSTRQGKTSIIRQLLVQLCYIGCICILLDPHYTPYDVDIDEDWTPYTPYLRFDPLKCKDFAEMEKILRHSATAILSSRKKLREESKSVGMPIFIIIDEYPAVIAERPKIQEYVALLLRQGAKYKIFLCVASQDFQVKTVSPQAGGAIRDSYKTCFYVGGDKTTANVLLDMPVEPRVEAMLGKGPTMLRCARLKHASLAYTPFTDNQALEILLGPSTYVPLEAGEDTGVNGNGFDMIDEGQGRREARQEEISVAPILPEKGRKAEDIDLNAAIAVYNTGATSRYQLAEIFGLNENQGRKLKETIEEKAKHVGG